MKTVYDALCALKGPAALATVVRVVGSAYRREGAKLLITAEGPTVGMLSGGCLEDDVRAHSAQTICAGVPQLLAYDVRADDDGLWGLNAGCNGLVEVLLEPVDPVLIAVAEEYRAGRPCVTMVATSEGETRGRRMMLRQDGSRLGTLAGGEWDRQVLAAAAGLHKPLLKTFGQTAVYLEPVVPPPLLWVVGGGADAVPLVQAAVAAGWRVRVVDRRSGYADQGRFPEADQVLRIEPEELAERAGKGAFAVFMHHNFDHDRDYLTAMLGTGARYLGVLGPLRRTLQILGSGVLPPEVYAPVGLDLGGDGPEWIAVSIVAEAQAILHQRTAAHLRGTTRPLHQA